MADMRCGRCQAPVSEQDLKAGRGAALGTLIMCEKCLAPAEPTTTAPAPKTESKDFQVLSQTATGIEIITNRPHVPATRTAAPTKPDSAAMPVAIPFSEAAVPIDQSKFFKDMDSESLGSNEAPTATSTAPTATHNENPQVVEEPIAVPVDRGRLLFAGIGCGVGSFITALAFYLVFLAPAAKTQPVAPKSKTPVRAGLELPPPSTGTTPQQKQAPRTNEASTRSTSPVPTVLNASSPGSSDKPSAKQAFEAIDALPADNRKERCRRLESFLKEYDDPIFSARVKVMLEKLKPVHFTFDFEDHLDGWEKWGDDLKTVTQHKHSGKKSLQAGPNGEGGGIWLEGFVPGKTYVVSFWSRTEAGVPDAYIGTEFGTAEKTKMEKHDFRADWQSFERRSYETTAPPNTCYLYFWVWRVKGGGNVYVDDVEITEKE